MPKTNFAKMLTPYKSPKFSRFRDIDTGAMGRSLAESMVKADPSSELVLKEQFGINLKEDVNTTNAAGSYTTLLSKTLYTAALDKIGEILNLVDINTDMVGNEKGFGAYKLPKLQPTIAVEVSEGAVISYTDEGIDSITVEPRKVVSGTALTWEIRKRGMTGFTKWMLKNAADAVSRKLASDIVNGLAAGAGSTGTGGVTYTNLTTSESTINDASNANSIKFGFMANALVVTPTTYATMINDTDIKEFMWRTTAKPGEIVIAEVFFKFSNLKIVNTPFLTAALAVTLDTEKAAVLVKESELETFEGQIPGRPYDTEIVVLMSYVLAIMYPDAIYKITA